MGMDLEKEMKPTKPTEEAFTYGMMVASGLDTLRMVLVLATTSKYGLVVASEWGIATRKMVRDGIDTYTWYKTDGTEMKYDF